MIHACIDLEDIQEETDESLENNFMKEFEKLELDAQRDDQPPGCIKVQDLKRILTEAGDKLSNDEFNHIMREAKWDIDGMITQEQLCGKRNLLHL